MSGLKHPNRKVTRSTDDMLLQLLFESHSFSLDVAEDKTYPINVIATVTKVAVTFSVLSDGVWWGSF